MAVGDKWLGDADRKEHWRDTMVKVTGPPAASLQSAFAPLWPIRLASHRYYEEMMEAGIRIYEYQATMIHTKSVIVDGKWSIVGSANMDIRFKELNMENACALYLPSSTRLPSSCGGRRRRRSGRRTVSPASRG